MNVFFLIAMLQNNVETVMAVFGEGSIFVFT